eukprot:768164-Hanusia_phi.AAC.1
MPEFSAGAKLHDHEELPVLLEDFIQLDDVLVVQGPQHLDFPSQTNKSLRLYPHEVDGFHCVLHARLLVRRHADG